MVDPRGEPLLIRVDAKDSDGCNFCVRRDIKYITRLESTNINRRWVARICDPCLRIIANRAEEVLPYGH